MHLSRFVKCALTVVFLTSLPELTFSQTTIGRPFSVLKKMEIDSSGNIVIKQGVNKKLYKCSYQGISYWITLDAKRTIDFVMTNDSQFSTSERLKIGSTFDEAINFSDNGVLLEKGWASYMKLESGWYAAFEPLDVNPKLSSKIKFFFKRYDLR